MKLVVIDDDVSFLTLYQKILEKHLLPNDEIFVTPDPVHAIELVKKKVVDLVITDLIMPQQNGLDILKLVKDVNPMIEVIVVTGQGSIDSAVKAMQLGARDYLTKPINQGMLLEKIQNIREFIGRVREVEDYRLAKETVETTASQTVADMEIKLNAHVEFMNDLRAILADTVTNADGKLRAINRCIAIFDKE
ncbi:MAG: response regulator [Chitinivibrionales bacterium]|nr:response regulator [Chitinivibrionales bacterium]